MRQSFRPQVRQLSKCEGPSLKNVALKAGGQRFHLSKSAANNLDFAEPSGYIFRMEVNPQAAGFVLYCTSHQKKWPALYDEMCRVAGQGLYQGLHHKDLRKLGVSLALNHIEETVQLIEAVTNLKIDDASLDSTS